MIDSLLPRYEKNLKLDAIKALGIEIRTNPIFYLVLLGIFLAPLEKMSFSLIQDSFTRRLNIHLVDLVFITAFALHLKNSRRILPVPEILPYISFLAILLLAFLSSLVNAVDMTEGFKGVLQFIYIFLLVLPLIVSYAKTKERVHLAAKMFALGAAVNIILSVLIYVFVGRIVMEGMSANSKFYGIGGLSRALNMGLPLILYVFITEKNKLLMIMWGGILSMGSVMLFLIYDRSVVLAGFVQFAIIFFLYFRFYESLKKFAAGLVLTVVLTSSIALFSYHFLLPEVFKYKVYKAVVTPNAATSVYRRLIILKGVAGSIDETLIIGYGMDDKNIIHGLKGHLKDKEKLLTYLPHNMWAYYWISTGFIAMLFVIYVCFYYIFTLFKCLYMKTLDDSTRLLLIACLVAVVGYYVTRLAHSSNAYRIDWVIYALGMAVANVCMLNQKPCQTSLESNTQD